MNVVVQCLEILVYEIIDLFPNLILALIPFYSFMRLSARKTGLLIMLLYLFICISRFLSINHYLIASAASTIWILLYLGFYLLCVRTEIGKLFFVQLIILNYGSLIAIIYSYILTYCFSQRNARPYSFSSSLLLGFLYLISAPLLCLIMYKKIKPLMETPENNKYWSFLWLVPATFCLSYYYNLYSGGGIILFSQQLSNVLFAVFFNVGGIFVTVLTTHLVEISNANLRLKSENYFLNMQSVQYDNLQNRIEDAKRANHDLRQMLTIINTFIRDNNQVGLANYISEYTLTLPPCSPIAYCENYAVNALIVYYDSIAAKNNISFTGSIQYPAKSKIADADAVVLLGNLLENAIDACVRQKEGSPYICLCSKIIRNILVITLENSYSGPIYTSNSHFLSSKGNRTGIGTDSVKVIASKYKGTAKFEYEDNLFHASVMLVTS